MQWQDSQGTQGLQAEACEKSSTPEPPVTQMLAEQFVCSHLGLGPKPSEWGTTDKCCGAPQALSEHRGIAKVPRTWTFLD